MHPHREVTGAVGDRRLVWQVRRQVPDDDGQIHALARAFLRHGDELLVFAPRVGGPVAPSRRLDRRHVCEARRRRGGCGDDGEVSLIDAVELVGIRMDVNEPRRDTWRLEDRIRHRRDVAQARAERDDQIRALDTLLQVWRQAEAEMSRVACVPVVDEILPPERCQHGKGIGFGEARERGAARL